MTEDDWDILLRWNNDPDVLYYVSAEDDNTQSLERVRQIYRGVSQAAFCFIMEVGGSPAGECWLQQMNLKRILNKYPDMDCRRIDIMIGKRELWGQGIGTEVIGILTSFGFEAEKGDMIFGCDIADYNPRSLRAFEKNGYRIDDKIEQPSGKKARFYYDLAISRREYENNKK